MLIAEAIAAGVAIDGVYVESTALAHPVVVAAEAAGIAVHEVVDGALTGITDAVTPRPVMAVAPIVESALELLIEGALATARPLLLLVEVGDPGNLGTILRAADAAGAAGVLCTKGTVDPWSPKAVRSSAGAVLHVPIATGLDPVAALALAGRRGVPRIATVVDTGDPHDECPLDGATLIVLGSEAHGLAPEHLTSVDRRVTIAMEGRAESLNVAMAASILCFEALRQRRAAGRETGAPPRTDWTAGSAGDKVIRP